jgi:CHAT domain-containing protein
LATKLGDRLRQSELAWRKAGVFYETGNFEQSAKLSAWAGDRAEEIHESNYSYLALTLTGKSHLALGQIEAARAILQNAILKVEQIRSRVGGQEQQRAFFFGRKIEPYHLMVDLLIRQNRPEEALEVAEKARSRSLLDLIGNPRSDPAQSMSSTEKEEDQKLSGQLATLNSQLYRVYQQIEPDRNRINELRIRLERARFDYDAFLDRLAVNHPELGADRGRPVPFSVQDTKTILGSSDVVIVEFVVLDDRICLFTLTLDDTGKALVRVYPVNVPKKKLTDAVQQFRYRITNNSLGIDKPAAELFQLLLGPSVATIKDKKTLIFVPDDVLWELPFQALKDAAGRYLIENHTVFYAPSLTALREMKHRQAAGRATAAVPVPDTSSAPMLLAFGNPALSSTTVANVRALDRDVRLGPLPAAKREVETIGNLYGASRSEVFVGAQATEDRAKAEMARYRILHFATHGILDGSNPLYSHVVLSQSPANSNEDGLLEAREIMKMDLNADLAVLSACETARGRISSGEGVIGMSWALFAAGVPTSMVSQWSVESNSTAKLMIDFHRALLSLNKNSDHVRGSAEALRQAALTMLRTPGYSHPLFWAGFIIIGDGGWISP